MEKDLSPPGAHGGRSKTRKEVAERGTKHGIDDLEESFSLTDYRLAIPGRILEMGPDELAGSLVKARTDLLCQEEVE